MTSIKETLNADVKEAMRSGDRSRRDTLRMVLAAIKQVEVDTRTPLDDQGVMNLLQKEAKKRQEAIADFERAGRADAAQNEHAELAIISAYLPAQAEADEITTRAQAIITEQGLAGPQAIGVVMKQLMAEFKGRADGKLVNQIVRQLLSN